MERVAWRSPMGAQVGEEVIGIVERGIKAEVDRLQQLLAPKPEVAPPSYGRSTCPLCGENWLVTGHADCLMPACGCFGFDSSADNVNRPCERCGMAHAVSCDKMPPWVAGGDDPADDQEPERPHEIETIGCSRLVISHGALNWQRSFVCRVCGDEFDTNEEAQGSGCRDRR
jgi:hypothetical protein